jgi:hypothetical protein
MSRNGLMSGWRLPALAVTVALVGLVAAARLGMRDTPPPRSIVAPTQVAPTALAALPTNAAQRPVPATIDPAKVVILTPSSLEFAYSPWPDRYADGIPRVVDGSPVLRLNAALDVARFADSRISPSLLIGAWFAGAPDGASGCSAQAYEPWCRTGRLADSPAGLGRGEAVVEVGNLPALGPGPLVIAATVQATCPMPLPVTTPQTCDFSLHADDVRWQGDEYTAAAPIAVGPLFSTLASFIWFDPVPFHERPGSCPYERPAQTYTAEYGQVQVAFVFPTAADRVEQGKGVVDETPAADGAEGCFELPPAYGASGWISQDNVMLRVTNVDGEFGDSVRSLLGDLSSADSQ